MESHRAPYDPNTLPDAVADEYHPSADRYLQNIKEIQRAIVSQSRGMSPLAVQAVKGYHSGETYTLTATTIGKSLPWVSKQVNSDDGQRLLALLAYYQEAINGPNDAQRNAMLWRVAVDSEQNDPKVAISAVAELNKQANIGKEALIGLTTGDINIVISNSLGKGVLDE